jgi:hypothetical protein
MEKRKNNPQNKRIQSGLHLLRNSKKEEAVDQIQITKRNINSLKITLLEEMDKVDLMMNIAKDLNKVLETKN